MENFFKNLGSKSITYDDFIILPGFARGFSPNDVKLETNFSRNIKLKLPFVSSPMDTVTGELVARWLALLGGLGIIHYNCSVDEQVKMVSAVKRFENGFILDPQATAPDNLIKDVAGSGYSTIPVTEGGKAHGRLVGMLTRLDYDLEFHKDLPVKSRMVALGNGLVVARKSEVSADGHLEILKANEIIREKRLLALPIVDEAGNLLALATRADIEKNLNFPAALKDKEKRLRVGAAIGTRDDDKKRVESLAAAGVDVLVIDSGHGHTSFVGEMIKFLKNNFPAIDVVAGNVATAAGVKYLAECGADAIRVGVGSGSICTTQEVTGVGRGQGTAVWECSQAAKSLPQPIPIIADGGIRKTGDMVKALLLGASSVMLGNFLAGTYESLGEWVELESGLKVKEYRGMGSKKAMELGSSTRYQIKDMKVRASEGVAARVLGKGHIYDLIPEAAAGLRQGLYKVGFADIASMRQAAGEGQVFIEQRSSAARAEGNVHDLFDVVSG